MVEQNLMEYLLQRTESSRIKKAIQELDMAPDQVFDGEIRLGNTLLTECWFPDHTMCGIAESPAHRTLYFTTRLGHTIFYSKPNKDIQ